MENSRRKNREAKRQVSPKTEQLRFRLEQRAQWCVQEINRTPVFTGPEMTERIRARYGIGQTQANVVYQRAREIIGAQITNFDIGTLWSKFLQISDDARHDKKYAAATRALYTGAVVCGLVKNKVLVEHSGRIELEKTAHLAVLELKPTDRRRREKELLEKAGLAGLTEMSVDEYITGALDELAGPAEPGAVADAHEMPAGDVGAGLTDDSTVDSE